jgi:hypothetical protein
VSLPAFPTLPAGVTCTPPPAMNSPSYSPCNTYTTEQNNYNALKANPLYKESGSSVGVGFVGALQLGVHF